MALHAYDHGNGSRALLLVDWADIKEVMLRLSVGRSTAYRYVQQLDSNDILLLHVRDSKKWVRMYRRTAVEALQRLPLGNPHLHEPEHQQRLYKLRWGSLDK